MSDKPMCPNCGQHPIEDHPETGCVLAALARVLKERGDISDEQLVNLVANVDVSAFWDDIGAIVDKLAEGRYELDESEA